MVIAEAEVFTSFTMTFAVESIVSFMGNHCRVSDFSGRDDSNIVDDCEYFTIFLSDSAHFMGNSLNTQCPVLKLKGRGE